MCGGGGGERRAGGTGATVWIGSNRGPPPLRHNQLSAQVIIHHGCEWNTIPTTASFNHVLWVRTQRIDVSQLIRGILVRPVGMAPLALPHSAPLPQATHCVGYDVLNIALHELDAVARVAHVVARSSHGAAGRPRTIAGMARVPDIVVKPCRVIRRCPLRACDLFGAGQARTRRSSEHMAAAAKLCCGARSTHRVTIARVPISVLERLLDSRQKWFGPAGCAGGDRTCTLAWLDYSVASTAKHSKRAC